MNGYKELVLVLNPKMYEAYKDLNLIRERNGTECYNGAKIIKVDANGFVI
jgi:hypothetical protein